MTKQQAVQIFGSGAALGRAIGVTRGRISQLEEGELPEKYTDRITGAVKRLGVKLKCVTKKAKP